MAEKTFDYQAIDTNGLIVSGSLSAYSKNLVELTLSNRGFNEITVTSKNRFSNSFKKAISYQQITQLTHEIATSISAGISPSKALNISLIAHKNKPTEKLLVNLYQQIQSGSSFYDSLRSHPQHFDPLFCHMVNYGEQTGELAQALKLITKQREQQQKIIQNIKQAIRYPLIVLILGLIISAILLIKVVPVLAQTFAQFDAELPAATLTIIKLSEIAKAFWWLFIPFLVVFLIYRLLPTKSRNNKWHIVKDQYKLKLPIIGSLIQEMNTTQAFQSLSICLDAGLSLTHALTLTGPMLNNKLYQKGIQQILDNVIAGNSFHQAMQKTDLFPPTALQLVFIGEESGKLSAMLNKLLLTYQERINAKIDNLSSLLEPFIMLVLGILIGGLLIAMYLPVFQLGTAI